MGLNESVQWGNLLKNSKTLLIREKVLSLRVKKINFRTGQCDPLNTCK